MNLYFDIDGVLLTRNKQVPDGASELLSFANQSFSCFWLTTHCRTGANRAVEYLSGYYQEPDLSNISKILPTNWNDSKTEGLDWDSEFLWLDDFAFEFERMELKKKDRLDSLVLVNLDREGELSRILQHLQMTCDKYSE
ncbi:MAG: hypothetical protein AAFX87_29455 [Bacteroidota bacterium]